MADPADQGTEDSPKDLRAKLEEAISVSKQATVRAENAERQLAFTQAGLTGLTDKQVKALVATHEGDMTADALKATATELGFATETKPAPTAETPAPSPQVPDTAAEAAELAALSGSAPAPPGDNPLSQEAINAKIASLDPGEELDEWLRSNAHLFGHGIG